MLDFFIHQRPNDFNPPQPSSSYYSAFATSPRETFELPPILPLSPFPSESIMSRQQSHPGSSTEGLIPSSHIEDTSVLNASGHTLQAHASRMDQRDAKHRLAVQDRVGTTRTKLRPKRPLEIRVLPTTLMRSNTIHAEPQIPPSLESDYSYHQSDVPTPTTYSQFSYGGSHSQMHPPASPISFTSSFTTTSSPFHGPSSSTLSEMECVRSQNRLEKLKRTLGTDVPIAVLLNASLRDGAGMTRSRYPQESPLMIPSVAGDVGNKGRRTEIGTNRTPPIFTAKEAGLANRAEKSYEVELVDTPESDSSAGGVKMTAGEEIERIKKFSKVTRILGEVPPIEVYQPISEPRLPQLEVIRDDESFLDFESDSVYVSPLSRLSFDLYSESILSLSSSSSEDEEVERLGGDAKHEDEGNGPLYNPSLRPRPPLPLDEGYDRLCTPSPLLPPLPTLDEGSDQLYNPSPRPRPPPRTDEGLDASVARYPYLRTPTPTSTPADLSSRGTSKVAMTFVEDERFCTPRRASPEPFSSYKVDVDHSEPKPKEFPSHQRTSLLPRPPSRRGPIPLGANVVPMPRPQLQPKARAASAHFPSYGHTTGASSSSDTVTDATRSGGHDSEFRVRRKRAAKLMKFFGQPVNLTYHDPADGLVDDDDDDDDGDEDDDFGSCEEGDIATLKELATDSKLGMAMSPSKFTTMMDNKEPPSTPSSCDPLTNADWMGTFAEVLPYAYYLRSGDSMPAFGTTSSSPDLQRSPACATGRPQRYQHGGADESC